MSASERIFQVLLYERSGYWSAHCVGFDLHAEARDRGDALAKLNEVYQLRRALGSPPSPVEGDEHITMYGQARRVELSAPADFPSIWKESEVRESGR
jgi:hypothetical protein